jgi:glycosidase
MVLNRNGLAASLALTLLLGLASCMKAPPVQRLSTPSPMAVAIVHDHGSALGAVPEALRSQIQSTLEARNLVIQEVPQPQYESAFIRKRSTRDRLQTFAGLIGDAPLSMLVETRAEYYSQLNGRYRWTVYVKFSLAKAGDPGPANVSSFSLPVMLSFDHQREEDALAYAAGPVARKLGQELDDFLAGLDMQTVVSTSPPAASPSESELDSIYFVMIDRFKNGDTSNDGEVDASDPQAFHGGDLAGLIDSLDHIQKLGVKTIWLSPIFSMRTEKIGEHGAFHGYWTEDLREVEKRFGNADDLKRLKEELAARDMSLVMDMVLNHVGYDTKFVTEHPDWFHQKGDIKDWEDPVQLTTYDVHGLPDLAQEKPEVYDFLLSASAQWIEDLQPIGFRLDAVKHVGGEFWEKYTRDIQAHSATPLAMIGELYNGNPSAIAAGFRDDGFSHLFDFPLYFAMNEVFCKGEHAGRLASIHSLDRLYPDPSRLITFADNHDLPRVWSACGEDTKRVEALLTFMLTARGIPSLNYGTEVPLAGGKDPDNRRDMDFSQGGGLHTLIGDFLELRRKHRVFRRARDVPLAVEKQRYAYWRVGEKESALVAINLSGEAWALEHPLAAEMGTDVRSGETIAGDLKVAAGSARVVLFPASPSPAYQALAKGGVPAPQSLVVIAEAEGKELRLVGGGPELGDWDPAKAPQGKLQADGSFRFDIQLPAGATGAFKLVRRDAGADQWEERGNRFITAREGAAPHRIKFGQTEEVR